MLRPPKGEKHLLTCIQNWQIGQFLVNKIYPEIEDADSPIVEMASVTVAAVAGES